MTKNSKIFPEDISSTQVCFMNMMCCHGRFWTGTELLSAAQNKRRSGENGSEIRTVRGLHTCRSCQRKFLHTESQGTDLGTGTEIKGNRQAGLIRMTFGPQIAAGDESPEPTENSCTHTKRRYVMTKKRLFQAMPAFSKRCRKGFCEQPFFIF